MRRPVRSSLPQRRPTSDLDVHAQQLAANVDGVRELVIDVADVAVDDKLDVDTSWAAAQMIREEDQYSGVQVTMAGMVAHGEVDGEGRGVGNGSRRGAWLRASHESALATAW